MFLIKRYVELFDNIMYFNFAYDWSFSHFFQWYMKVIKIVCTHTWCSLRKTRQVSLSYKKTNVSCKHNEFNDIQLWENEWFCIVWYQLIDSKRFWSENIHISCDYSDIEIFFFFFIFIQILTYLGGSTTLTIWKSSKLPYLFYSLLGRI